GKRVPMTRGVDARTYFTRGRAELAPRRFWAAAPCRGRRCPCESCSPGFSGRRPSSGLPAGASAENIPTRTTPGSGGGGLERSSRLEDHLSLLGGKDKARVRLDPRPWPSRAEPRSGGWHHIPIGHPHQGPKHAVVEQGGRIAQAPDRTIGHGHLHHVRM